MPKNPDIFCCENCDFECSKKSNYIVHIGTAKHKNRTDLKALEQSIKNTLDTIITPSYVCKNCNKYYKARNSLWYHEKVCKIKLK